MIVEQGKCSDRPEVKQMVQRTRSTATFDFDPKFPWMGAEGEGNTGDGTTDGGTGGAPAGDAGTTPPAATTGGESVSKADYDAIFQRMQAADRAKAEAEAKLRAAEDKERSELEIAKRDAAEAAAALEAAKADLQNQRIENAFLASNKYDWHNPQRALQVADLSGVEIGSDGKVKGLEAALDALAKSDPYLLKSKDSEDGKEKPPASGGAGDGRGSTSGGSTPDPNRDALLQKYPVLRR